MDRYSQMMRVKTFDIEAGALISIMHEIDAKELGVLPLDRVELTNIKNGKKVVTVVDHTTTMVEPDEIGLFEDAQKELLVFRGDQVEVKQSPQPESVSFIKKKLSGGKLSEKEIKSIVDDISKNKLSNIEMGAFMTAIYIRGFDLDETTSMTKALVEDGQRLKLKKGPVLDKHSIGGINGRTTMVLVPIVASLGCVIPKTSSRSITSAAGTADVMEVLADVCLPMKRIKSITEKTGAVIVWGGAVD
ncbi:MAG: thymidine phosphorylase, partial [Candidatus ainarchaeum sp.]|nr:thymidine phosphorylase [Candidatus ainarchaeum sp.]